MESRTEDSIQVCIRIRPDRDQDNIVTYSDTEITIDKNRFCFDHIFSPQSTQNDIFDAVGHKVLKHTLDGYNGCIFVYGQTGSGKTYTMIGDDNGLMQKSFVNIFTEIESMNDSKCLLTCSYYQIYNQQIIDLLDAKKDKKLSIRQDTKKGVFVENLTEQNVYSSYKLMECLSVGMKNRHVGETMMNRESSRSHSIFTISLSIQTQINGVKVIKTPKLHFVDLAGSERQKMTAASGDRLKEAGNINKSLTTLGMVINALTSQRVKSHIPYRDSKLTNLLRDSLGGNSKTFLIATISRSLLCFQETLSTLNFANRAKMVKVKALINEQSLTNNIEIFKDEIRRLKAEIANLKSQKNVPTQYQRQMMTLSSKSTPTYNYDEQFKEINEKISSISSHIIQNVSSPNIQQIMQAIQLRDSMEEQQGDNQEPNQAEQALIHYLSNNNRVLSSINSKIEEYTALKEGLHSKVYSEQMYINQLKTPSKFEREQYEQVIKKKNQQIDKLFMEMNLLKNQLCNNEIRFKELEQQFSNKTGTIEQRDVAISKYQSEALGLKKEILSLKNILSQTNNEKELVFRRLQDAQKQSKQNKQLYLYAETNYETEKELRQQIESNLYDKLAQIDTIISKYETKLQEKKEYYEELEETLSGQINVLNQTVEFNERKLSETQDTLKHIRHREAQTCQQNTLLQNQNQQLNQSNELLNRVINELKGDQNKMRISMINSELQNQRIANNFNQLCSQNHKSKYLHIYQSNVAQEQRDIEEERTLGQIQNYDNLVSTLEHEKSQLALEVQVGNIQIEKKQTQNEQILHQKQTQIQQTIHKYQQILQNHCQKSKATIEQLQSKSQKLQHINEQLEVQVRNANKQVLCQNDTIKELQDKLMVIEAQSQKITQQVNDQKKKIEQEKVKLAIEIQQTRKAYKNITRQNYRLKNRYSNENKEHPEELVKKLEFYEEKFKLMTLDYNKAQEVVNKTKQKQLSLLQKIAYLQQTLRLKTSESDHQPAIELISQNKALKKQLEQLKNNEFRKQSAVNLYTNKKKNYSEEKEKFLEQKEQTLRLKLIDLLNRFNSTKENSEELGNRSLDDLLKSWDEVQNQSLKQLDVISRGIKKQQKLKVQNNCIVKQNIYLKQTIANLQSKMNELDMESKNPRKYFRPNTQCQ